MDNNLVRSNTIETYEVYKQREDIDDIIPDIMYLGSITAPLKDLYKKAYDIYGQIHSIDNINKTITIKN